MNKNAMSLFLGGLLPVIIFTLIEEYYGTIAGLIAGMIFGFGEILFEKIKYKKIQKMTLFGNGMLLFLGLISLVLSDGIWFKLQPAILELFFALVLIYSFLMKKNILEKLMSQQGQSPPEIIKPFLQGMTFRIGLFFLFHAFLATYAAYYWSTEAWAALKGFGFTVSFILYMVLEVFFIRKKIQRDHQMSSLNESQKISETKN